MGSVIHPSAVIDKTAKLGSNIVIGPFSVVEAGVEIGDGTILDTHVIVGKDVKLGKNNRLFANCVIGRPPQVLNFDKPAGGLIIGDNNVIREFATIHPSMHSDQNTIIGNNNLLMIGIHLGHDCILGDRIVMSNYTQISGHCHIQTGVWFSGMVAVHQFCTIGKWCYAAGYTGIAHDIPPFMIVSGHYPSEVRGVNKRGVKRAGLSEQQLEHIEKAYRFIWRSKDKKSVLEQVKTLAEKDGLDENVRAIIELVMNMSKQRFGRHLELFRD
jgi:UDP-N-acetylglucosamine acyltransferase